MQRSPFYGVYITSEGKFINILDGREVLPIELAETMIPFYGVFFDKDGNRHDLTEVSGGGGSGGLTKVNVDGITITGDGTVSNPLKSPRQGLNISGPYDSLASITTPYDPLLIYLVGTTSPYAEYVLVDSNLVEIGTTESPLTNYYTKSETLSLIDNISENDPIFTVWKNEDYATNIISLTNRISNLETALSNTSTVQPVYIKAYSDNNSNTFTLPKTPDVITDVWVLDGDDAMYYLRTNNYNISGKDVTISSPSLTSTMQIKIIYTSKEV